MYISGKLEKITAKNNIVHTYPTSDYNEEGIRKAFGEVYVATANIDHWVLFEHPSDDAGLTLRALECLSDTYRTISGHGCIGIAIEISSVFNTILKDLLPKDLDVPLLISQDGAELNEFVFKVLAEHKG